MKLFLSFLRFLISLRYKVKLNGVYKLEHSGPVLVLPNHVALVDPCILMCYLGKYLKLSPVASEKYYAKPGFKLFMDIFETVPIGDIRGGADHKKVEKIFDKVATHLKSGKNILIYPSGQVYRQGFESIIGKQAVYNIASMMPNDIKVIGIRTTGLRGSMFSMSWDNGKTSLVKLIIYSFFLLLANLFFFLPKREVNIDIEDLTLDIKKYSKKSLDEFNKYLEDFYNKKIPHSVSTSFQLHNSRSAPLFTCPNGREEAARGEEIKYLKHYFYFDDVKNRKIPEIITGSLKELEMTQKYDLRKIPDEVKMKIKSKIAFMKEIDITGKTTLDDDIYDNSKLTLDLFFDSLDLAEVKSYVQSNFSLASNPPINDLKTVGDLLVMAVGKSKTVEKLKECNWGKNTGKSIKLVEKFS